MIVKGKVVVVTGSTKGLGKALAEAFIKEGATVVVSGKDEAEVASVATEVGATGILADVTNEQDINQLVSRTIEKFGRLDIWVNNAGIWIPHEPVEELDMKRVHQVMEVNVFGTMYGSRAALAQMKKQGTGIIVNILSTSGLAAKAQDSAYCASKYAATGFTKSLQLEIEGSSISLIGVYPARMQTDLFDEQKPADIGTYMTPASVAGKIVGNLLLDVPSGELVIRQAD